MKSKTTKIALEGFGSYLGMQRGSFVVRDKDGKEERYPLFESEIGEVRIRSGNTVSAGALASIGFWQIDCLLLSGRGRPIAILRSLDDDSHVSTRIAQYESLKNGKFSDIAKQFVLSKIEGQNELLKKYGLRRLDYSHIEKIKSIQESDIRALRVKLTNIESHCSRLYFNQVFGMFSELLRPSGRKAFKAYDGINNLFNLAYEVLSWKVHLALLKARLEPFLGYLHSLAWSKPSLVCDFKELYRYLMDDFVIQYAKKLGPRDFILKTEEYANRKGKREYINDLKTRGFMKMLDDCFLSEVEVPRVRIGKKQELETLINEEALLFASYLRNEKQTWIPRTVEL
ncbi:MAG: CRISPR-associated endonuclease Cas1 [Candidatus Bathyarchaeia archaeon]|jgi:CRISPR-associated protein Cas1